MTKYNRLNTLQSTCVPKHLLEPVLTENTGCSRVFQKYPTKNILKLSVKSRLGAGRPRNQDSILEKEREREKYLVSKASRSGMMSIKLLQDK